MSKDPAYVQLMRAIGIHKTCEQKSSVYLTYEKQARSDFQITRLS